MMRAKPKSHNFTCKPNQNKEKVIIWCTMHKIMLAGPDRQNEKAKILKICVPKYLNTLLGLYTLVDLKSTLDQVGQAGRASALRQRSY
jgi:hypothetical protein